MREQNNAVNSLAHTKWNCKYHSVFAPKYRRKVFFQEKRVEVREILRTLCQWKGVEIIEGDGDAFAPYDEAINVSTVLINDAILNELVLSYYPNESIRDNRFTKLYKDKLNVNLYYSWIANSDDEYNDKINLAIASNALPDLFQVDAAQMQMLVEDGLIHDLSEIWDQYASPLLKEVVGDTDDPVFQSYMYDGKVYAIPESRSAYDTVQFAWIRMDWLEKLVSEKPELGLTLNPTTYDDFIKIVKAFKLNFNRFISLRACGDSLGYTGLKGDLIVEIIREKLGGLFIFIKRHILEDYSSRNAFGNDRSRHLI